MQRTRISIAVTLVAVILGGCGSSERPPDREQGPTASTIAVTTAVHPERLRRPSIPLERYSASEFAARVPVGWTLEDDGTAHDGYTESKWRDPDHTETSITIDAGSGESKAPADKAAEVRAQIAGTTSYREVGFAPSRLSAQEAFRWVFDLSGDRRVDYFLSDCGTDIAVLGSTTPSRFRALRATFKRVAASVRVACSDEPVPTTSSSENTSTSESPTTTPSDQNDTSSSESSLDDSTSGPTSSTPDTDFCASHDCIDSFDQGTGYPVQCADGKWSDSGGRPGACSYNGGEAGNSEP